MDDVAGRGSGRHVQQVRSPVIVMSDIVVTQGRTAGYFLAAILGIFAAWLVTATVDATKQAMRPSFTPQALVQGGQPR